MSTLLLQLLMQISNQPNSLIISPALFIGDRGTTFCAVLAAFHPKLKSNNSHVTLLITSLYLPSSTTLHPPITSLKPRVDFTDLPIYLTLPLP